jgi:hypothetical protein
MIANFFAQTTKWSCAKTDEQCCISIKSIKMDSEKNSYITGWFNSYSVTLGNNSQQLKNTNHSENLMVAKLDPKGNILWAKNVGNTMNTEALGIAIDKSGNSYITGFFEAPSITFGSFILKNVSSNNAISNNSRDLFITKYDNMGNVVWAKSCGGTKKDQSTSISADENGNILIAGTFSSPSIKFGAITLTNNGEENSTIFIAKYNSSGDLLWATSAGGDKNDDLTSITTDTENNVFIAGSFYGFIAFDTTRINSTDTIYSDIFVAKYNASGHLLWVKKAGGHGQDAASSIAVDISGNCYVTGLTGHYQSASLTFDSIILMEKEYGEGKFKLFIAKYDSKGNALWARTAGSNETDMNNAVVCDISGNCYLAGSFDSKTIAFDDKILENKQCSSSMVFITKFDTKGKVTWLKSPANDECLDFSAFTIDPQMNCHFIGSHPNNSTVFTFKVD